MELHLHIKWVIVIVATIVWLVLEIGSDYDGPFAILGSTVPTFLYLLFWIIWLIVF